MTGHSKSSLAILGSVAYFMAGFIPMNAQTTASIRGTIRDEQGAVLPRAMLTARQLDTNTVRTSIAGDSGEFYLPNLPAGKYTIKVELTGFSGVESTVELTIGR